MPVTDITKDIEKDALAVERAEQKQVRGWAELLPALCSGKRIASSILVQATVSIPTAIIAEAVSRHDLEPLLALLELVRDQLPGTPLGVRESAGAGRQVRVWSVEP